MITLVACIDMNNGIGNNNGELLFDLPKDMAHFQSITTGKHVVMGRKTWDSLPEGKKPLPKRKNYVLTNDESFEVKGKTKVFNSIEDVLDMAKSRDVYIIGGGEIYNQFIDHAERLIITHVHTVDISARVFFPDYDINEWKMKGFSKNEADDKHAHSFTFATYERRIVEEVEEAVLIEQQEEQTKE